MPKYRVTVRYEQEREISVHAANAQIAEKKAVAIVESWQNVEAAEVVKTDEA